MPGSSVSKGAELSLLHSPKECLPFGLNSDHSVTSKGSRNSYKIDTFLGTKKPQSVLILESEV